VALCVFSGKFLAASASGCREREVEVVMGRRKRERKDGIWKAINATRRARQETIVVDDLRCRPSILRAELITYYWCTVVYNTYIFRRAEVSKS
jgi:hypothetical protein